MIDHNELVIFSGPTLGHKEIQSKINATILPPAAQGDLLRAYHEYKPRSMAIIDGYYESRPAIWHKELLFLLSQGIHVYGASSMGALRAAELSDFGMVGIGEVYKRYKSGDIEDDDEVAVLHAPHEFNYTMLSEAMINIRTTLEAATANHIISSEMQGLLTQKLKGTFYKERTRNLIHDYYDELSGSGDAEFHTWVESNFINQKYLDALMLIEHLVQLQNKNRPPLKVTFNFYRTSLFQQLLQTT